VKCFLDPSLEGTIISEATPQTPYPPIIVWKDQQVLLSIQDKDFSFIAEKHLTSIFNLFNQHRVHIHLMQNSAISFSVCVDANPRVSDLIKDLSHQFDVVRNEGMRLLTIRHYDESTIAKHLAGNEVLVEQRSRSTIQLVTRKK
jgi:aspartate kinase